MRTAACDNEPPLLLKSAFRWSVRANASTGRIAVAYKRCLPSPPANAGVRGAPTLSSFRVVHRQQPPLPLPPPLLQPTQTSSAPTSPALLSLMKTTRWFLDIFIILSPDFREKLHFYHLMTRGSVIQMMYERDLTHMESTLINLQEFSCPACIDWLFFYLEKIDHRVN